MTRGWVNCQVGNFSLNSEWAVEPGSILVLFGASGSGKTTTLRAIAGLLQPQQGHIEVGGSVVFDHQQQVWVPPHQRRVGYVPQEYHLFPHLDVAGNIGYGLKNPHRSDKQRRVSELVETLRLEGLERRYVWELSGGQRQRVALARALAPQPSVLLLDEPFAALDLELRRTLRQELRSLLKSSGIPVIFVTHDQEEALALGDSVQILEQGRGIALGEPLSVLGHPGESRVARLVGVENLLRLSVVEMYPKEGVMICETAGIRLEAPLVNASVGQMVTVGIRARDIIIASEDPKGLSARNLLRSQVKSVEPIGAGYDILLDCGEDLRCHITQRALTELEIAPGKTVWAVVKASSIFVVND